MQIQNDSMEKEVVLSYIKALDNQDYNSARNYLKDNIRIKGNSTQSFNKPRDFIEMLRRLRGKYEIKKVFADGQDVCLLYNFETPVATVFMCSWYQVKDGRIASIQTIFDPHPFDSAQGL
jgi:limonene-1,2-epoxide hydrolase